jgi:hypothetical protein
MIPLPTVALTGQRQTVYLGIDTDVYDRIILTNQSQSVLDCNTGIDALRLQANSIDLMQIDGQMLQINPFASGAPLSNPVLQVQAVRKDEQLTESYPIVLSFTPPTQFTAMIDFAGGITTEGVGARFSGMPWYDQAHPSFAGGGKADGATDNQPMSQAVFSAAVAGGIVLYSLQGIYVHKTPIVIVGNGITVIGSLGAILQLGTAANCQLFKLTGATKMTFIGLTIDQNGPNQSAPVYGIYLDVASVNCFVLGTVFINTRGFAVFVFNGPLTRTTNLKILAITVYVMANAPNDIIATGSNGGSCTASYIQVGSAVGINVYETDNFTTEANTVHLTENGGTGIACSSSYNSPIKGNTVEGGNNDVLIAVLKELDNVGGRAQTDCLIEGNTLRRTPGSAGAPQAIQLRTTSDTDIKNNKMYDCFVGINYQVGPNTSTKIKGNTGRNFTIGWTANTGNATGSIYRDNDGLNPVGQAWPQTAFPAFPASTVAITNQTGVDVTYTVTAGVNAVTVQVDAVVLGVIPANQVLSVPIPAGSTFKPTYAGGAPTGVAYGN